MQGKICLVTGATAGIGQVTARELARQGATVALVGRNPQKTEETVRQIQQATGNQRVTGILGDLSKLADVRRVADEFRARHDRLDVLVNNAGALFPNRETTADGFEMTFGLNHMSYFMLTHHLLDLLKKSAPARIVNVASDAHRGMKLDFDDLQSERGYMAIRTYGRSKLANILFTAELSRRLQGSGVTANVLHPGVVASSFGDTSKLFSFLKKTFRFFYLTSEQGAETILYLATSPEVDGVSGQYFAKKKARRPSSAARDMESASRLWSTSEKLFGAKTA